VWGLRGEEKEEEELKELLVEGGKKGAHTGGRKGEYILEDGL
jgi:hypothetical protein